MQKRLILFFNLMSMEKLEKLYKQLYGVTPRDPVTMAVAALLFVAALVSLRWVGTNLIPPISEGEFYFEVNLPEGTPLTVTDRVGACAPRRSRSWHSRSPARASTENVRGEISA